VQSYVTKKPSNLKKYVGQAMEKIPKFNKRRAFNKAVGPGKNPKLINVVPTFIPDKRVMADSMNDQRYIFTFGQS
jgi:hypothetical protein